MLLIYKWLQILVFRVPTSGNLEYISYINTFAYMKTFTAITALVCISAICLNAEERTITVNKAVINTRSITQEPYAKISDADILTVTFDDSGVYSLYIENCLGEIVYTSTLPADGIEYNYDLTGIGTGLLRLVIDGYGGEYEGYFTL